MPSPSLPSDLRRYITTQMPSIPYLEALLLLRAQPALAWQVHDIAARLYVSGATASAVMTRLVAADLVEAPDPERLGYAYRPPTPELADMIDRLAAHYALDLVTITDLIHSRVDRRAARFSDAFRWRKDT